MIDRPHWCPHSDCLPLSGDGQSLCGGRLPEPEPHGNVYNTHRLCLRGAPDDGEWVHPMQVNANDCYRLGLTLEHIRDDAKGRPRWRLEKLR